MTVVLSGVDVQKMYPNTYSADYSALRLINQVLYLYYFEGLNQADIAKRLDLSTIKVSRLLKQARDQGMVEIKIRTPLQAVFDLEHELQSAYKLSESVVVPQMSDDFDVTMQAV